MLAGASKSWKSTKTQKEISLNVDYLDGAELVSAQA